MELFTRTFMLIGYLAVAVNALLQLRKSSRFRSAVLVSLPTALFWLAFYGHVTFGSTANAELLVQWSRLGHTFTIGALLYLQYIAGLNYQREAEIVLKAIREADIDVG